jgi:hypothetical protein
MQAMGDAKLKAIAAELITKVRTLGVGCDKWQEPCPDSGRYG